VIGIDPSELKVGDKVLRLAPHRILIRGEVIEHKAYGKVFFAEGMIDWLLPKFLVRDDGRFPEGKFINLTVDQEVELWLT